MKAFADANGATPLYKSGFSCVGGSSGIPDETLDTSMFAQTPFFGQYGDSVGGWIPQGIRFCLR